MFSVKIRPPFDSLKCVLNLPPNRAMMLSIMTDRPADVVAHDKDQPSTDQNWSPTMTNHVPTDQEPVPIEVAAVTLGITVNAVRQRLKRRTLQGHKAATGWVVFLPTDQPTKSHLEHQPTNRPTVMEQPLTDRPTDQAAIAPLADLIADLSRENRELAAAAALWQERARYLGERLHALEAGPMPTSGLATADTRSRR